MIMENEARKEYSCNGNTSLWMSLAFFFLGVLVGFVFSPIKNGIRIACENGCNNGNNCCAEGNVCDLCAGCDDEEDISE